MFFNPSPSTPSTPSTPFATVTSSLSNSADYLVPTTASVIYELGFTGNGYSAILPAANTPLGKGLFSRIVNAGSYSFCVRDNSHKFLAVLNPSSGSATTRQQCDCVLENNSTSAGVWRISNTSEFSALSTFFSGVASVGSASSANNVITVNLDATHFLAIYSHTAASIYGIVGTVSGETITWGADTLIVTVTHTAASKSATLLTSGLVLMSYAGASGFLNAIAIDVSGATITPNTNAVLNAVATNFTGVCTLSSTVGAVIYAGTTGYSYVATLTVSGSSPTRSVALGTPSAALVATMSQNGAAIATISSNSVIAIFNDSWAGLQSVVVSALTSAGGTVNSIVVVNAAEAAASFSIAAFSSTAFGVAFQNNTTPVATMLTVSGTTITKGTVITLLSSNSSEPASFVPLSASKALFVDNLVMFFLDWDGTTLTYELPQHPTVTASTGAPLYNPAASPLKNNLTNQALAVMNANQAVGVFVDATPNVNALTIEQLLP